MVCLKKFILGFLLAMCMMLGALASPTVKGEAPTVDCSRKGGYWENGCTSQGPCCFNEDPTVAKKSITA
uniref:Putative secreted protein n=1 Tax=Xenopsylla cheopis TaxID=163159 RepID=A0A6M2DUQ5_XENCH